MNLIEAGLEFGHALRNDYLAKGNDELTEKYTKELLDEEMSERLWELFNSKVASRSFFGFSDALSLLSTASFDEQRPITQYWVDLQLVVNDNPVLQELAKKYFEEGELVERLITSALIPGSVNTDGLYSVEANRLFNEFAAALKRTGVTRSFAHFFTNSSLDNSAIDNHMKTRGSEIDLKPCLFNWAQNYNDDPLANDYAAIDLTFFLVCVARRSVFSGFMGDLIDLRMDGDSNNGLNQPEPIKSVKLITSDLSPVFNKRFAPMLALKENDRIGYILPSKWSLEFSQEVNSRCSLEGLLYPPADLNLFSYINKLSANSESAI